MPYALTSYSPTTLSRMSRCLRLLIWHIAFLLEIRCRLSPHHSIHRNTRRLVYPNVTLSATLHVYLPPAHDVYVLLRLWTTRSAPSTGNKKYLMTDQCVISSGPIPMVSVSSVRILSLCSFLLFYTVPWVCPACAFRLSYLLCLTCLHASLRFVCYSTNARCDNYSICFSSVLFGCRKAKA